MLYSNAHSVIFNNGFQTLSPLRAAAAPYQDEPLARPREGGAVARRHDDGEDKDGLSRQTLADRYEGRSRLEEW